MPLFDSGQEGMRCPDEMCEGIIRSENVEMGVGEEEITIVITCPECGGIYTRNLDGTDFD